MPSANDTLSGETKTLESRWAALIVFQSPNENAFDAARTSRSAAVSWRGKDERAGLRSPGIGSVSPPEHAVSRTKVATAILRTVMCWFLGLKRRTLFLLAEPSFSFDASL